MELTHLDKNGNAIMVDVSEKEVTHRTATACGKILVNQEILASIKENTNKKGDVLAVARIAGIMAAKRTSELIPLCHLLMLTKCTVDFTINEEENYIENTSKGLKSKTLGDILKKLGVAIFNDNKRRDNDV